MRNRDVLPALALLALGLLSACGRSEPPTSGGPPVVRRLTEAQYRNIIADVFGPQIVVAGRFDPIVRTEGLLTVGAGRATVTPSGVERFSAMAAAIARQVVAPDNRELLIPCQPANAAAADDACARQFLQRAGRLLYRRAVGPDDIAMPVALAAKAAAARGDFYDGLAYGLQAMLASPDFLFVTESTVADPRDAKRLRLDGYSRASRLSFMLWNTTPDDALLTAAEHGELDDADAVEQQVERLMDSPRFEQGVRAFFSDMLSLDDFATLEKDSVIYPAFGLRAANDSREQVLRTLVAELLDRDGDYRDIFTTRRTFMTVPLGVVYRVPAANPGGWAPFEFPADDPRAGIQTQLSFVALHSHPGKSSPTLRGKAIRELLLCQKVPDPPGNVNFDRFNDPNSPARTARMRLAAHATEPACAGCHKLMDPIGLALENFDGAGQVRLTENGARIDPSGELNGHRFADARGLGQAMHDDPAATSCLVRRAYSYAAARPIQSGERAWLTDLEARFAADGYRLKPLFRRIAVSDALQSVARGAT
ncbi:MAG: DUF1592 domain-containing protein [Steroidobacteraceae bacterium]